MSLRQSRRRRLVSDDAPSAGDEDDAPIRLADEPANDADSYTPAMRRSRSSAERLAPLRLFSIGLLVFAALATVGLIELLHLAGRWLGAALGTDEVAALNLDGTRNLSHWFASTLLVACALLAVYIFSMRRHRIDDYHGRYRVWIWMCLAALVASGVETADLAKLAHSLVGQAAAASAVDVALVWPLAVAALLAAIGVRLLIEVRRSLPAGGALVLSAMLFLAGAVIERTGLGEFSNISVLLVARGLWLAGYVFIFATFLLFARHVTLDVDGFTTQPPRRGKRGKGGSRDSDSEPSRSHAVERPRKSGSNRTDLDPVETPAAGTPRLQLGSGKSPAAAANDPATLRSMSRAERRRLRRESKMAS